jgi:uncharacterized phage protein gp47/JayE
LANTPPVVGIDYTSRDYDGIKASMLDYASRVFPQWTDRSTGDFGMLLVDMFAREMDVLSYYEDRIADEAYISTATQRSNVLALAQMLGYIPANAAPATGTVTFVTDASTSAPVTIPAGTQVLTGLIPALGGPLTFETAAAVTVPAAGGTGSVLVTEGVSQGTTTLSLYTGTSSATSVQVVNLGASDGSANQTFTLPTGPVIDGTVRMFVGYPSGPIEWFAVTTLLDAAGSDQSFAATTDDKGAVTITFGDGVFGAIPPAGLVVYAAYRIGGGTRGNLPAGSITDIATLISGVSISSSTATTGGLDPEPTDLIRQNAPSAFRALDRATTLSDYRDLALAVPAVARANTTTLNASYTTVPVFITATGNLPPSAALITTVQNFLQSRALAGVTVAVNPGTFVGVNIGTATSPVVIGVYPNFSRSQALARAQQTLISLFAPENIDFAMRIPLASVYTALASIPGVQYVQIPVMARADGPQNVAGDVSMRAWEIPSLNTPYLSAVGGV